MSNTRDTDALTALRTRLETVTGLWPIVSHNDKAGATRYGPSDGYIIETPIGGPTRPTTLTIGGTSGLTPPTRERLRQWYLLLHAPVNSGTEHVQQAEWIESALQATPITIADTDPDGPIPVLIDDVSVRPPRPQTRTIPHVTVPVVVSYRLRAT